MTDYIEREAVREAMHNPMLMGLGFTEWELDRIPMADAERVVRCRDCKYWQDNNGGYPHEECRWGKGETPDADDFCSFGERRSHG